MNQIETEKLISKKLQATVDHCKFKSAWLPKGWACIEIVEFAKDLAKEIESATNKRR